MHELSVAEALYDLVQRVKPVDAKLLGVKVKAGPMRAIDPEQMQTAWQVLLETRQLPPVTLHLTLLPWTLVCLDCDRSWTDEQIESTCTCGSRQCRPVGGDELQLVAIEVDDEKGS
jgi:Zn finger protein HypA/HybF involved in hydrogenase expression